MVLPERVPEDSATTSTLSGMSGVVAGRSVLLSKALSCSSCSGDKSCDEDAMTIWWLKCWLKCDTVGGAERTAKKAEDKYAMCSGKRRDEGSALRRAPI